ncbi:MAG: M67 family metallopeptidase [Erythrobacter sp.]|nr:M67 family metallopeptidase [Erythrobacter sp.]
MRLSQVREGELAISKRAYRALQKEADKSGQQECCGLLLGREGRIVSILPAENVHPNPRTHFEIDPQVLIGAYKSERAGGPDVIGYYHSHPLGNGLPSDTDRASSARDGKVWAIIGYDGLRFWVDAPDGFRALSYAIAGR